MPTTKSKVTTTLGVAGAAAVVAVAVWWWWNGADDQETRQEGRDSSLEDPLLRENSDIPTDAVAGRILREAADREEKSEDSSSEEDDGTTGAECCGGTGDGCGCSDARSADPVTVAEDMEDVKAPFPKLSNEISARIAPLIIGDDDEVGEYVGPETIKVFVKTFGCSHNISDSEVMAGLLKQAGFQLVDRWEEANCAVLNSCTVKNPSQDGAVNLAVKCMENGIKVVMAGCVPQADQSIPQLRNVSIIGVKRLDKVVEAVTETLQGNVFRAMSFKGDLPSLELPKVRRNELIEIIPLSTGCLGACTYCKTRQARGVLGSYPMDAILGRVRQAAREGVQQIWLTSEDTGAYGIDLGVNIADLLEHIADALAEEKASGNAKHIMCRLGMTNPPYMLAHLERLAKVLRGPHFFEFIHIPVQSGSDRVLLDMNREYTVAEFHQCASGLLESVPDLLLATDFICGFPDETDDDHRQSEELLLQYKFPSLNISQFYPRPGTPAAKRKRVPTQIVKARSQSMTKAYMDYTTFDKFVGRTAQVWFSGVSDKSDHVVGHTKQYVKVLVPRDDSLIGTMKMVKFDDCSKWHLVGSVVGPVTDENATD